MELAVAVAVPGASSLSVTCILSLPGAVEVCDPVNVYEPPELLTVPAVVVPSPQLIVAEKSPAAFAVSASLKVATTTLFSAWSVAAPMVVPCAVSASCSATLTWPSAVVFTLSEVRVIDTLAGALPSSV